MSHAAKNADVAITSPFEYSSFIFVGLMGFLIFAEIFSSDEGQEILNYLTNITMHSPAGPGTSNEVLQHQSGQSWIVGLIRKRTELGKEF